MRTDFGLVLSVRRDPVFRHGRVQAAKSALGACSQAILKRVDLHRVDSGIRKRGFVPVDALFPSDVFHVTPFLEVVPWVVPVNGSVLEGIEVAVAGDVLQSGSRLWVPPRRYGGKCSRDCLDPCSRSNTGQQSAFKTRRWSGRVSRADTRG